MAIRVERDVISAGDIDQAHAVIARLLDKETISRGGARRGRWVKLEVR